MKVSIGPGKYVLAVSGGVDSMVLLHLLERKQNEERGTRNVENLPSPLAVQRSPCILVVAHFNHGIRRDSREDEILVRNRAKELNLPFEAGFGHLGASASEAAARKARYGFLKTVQAKYRAKAIITAHHQDDWIETALLNILRGTGRKGLSSIANNAEVIRPLLKVPKNEIVRYAIQRNLRWREDSTNSDSDYLRNHLRHKVLPKMTKIQKDNLICCLEKIAEMNIKIDSEIATLSHSISSNKTINRQRYTSLPFNVSSEVLSYWLRQSDAGEIDRMAISRLDLAIRTARPGTLQPIKGDDKIVFDGNSAHLRNRLGKIVNGLI